MRELRAELDRLKRKVDNIEAELRRLRRPVPAFADIPDGPDDDESE